MSHDYFDASFMPLALSKLEIFNIVWTYPPLGAQGFLSGMIQIPSVTIASYIFLYNMGGFIGGFWYLESN